jgi:phage gp36-like protein
VPYTTLQDLIDRFGRREIVQLTDRAEPPSGAIDEEVVNRAITDADAEIDSYLMAAGYELPLDPIPTVIRRLAPQIVRHLLYDDVETELVRQRYDDARRVLEAIVAGKIKLGEGDVSGSAGSPQVSKPDRVFTQAGLKDF